MQQDKIILSITPQTGIKVSPNAAVLFRMPEDCPVPCGLPRRSDKQPTVSVATMKDDFPDLWAVLGGEEWNPRKKKKEIRYGCPHMISQQGLYLKNRINKMNKYREDVLSLAKKENFELPVCGWSVYFYMPMPVQWSAKKRKAMAGQLNMAKPDVDNMYKLLSDALSTKDERMAQLSGLGKFWIDCLSIDSTGKKNRGEGHIEILINQPVYNPFGVEFINQDEFMLQPKRKWLRRQEDDPKKRKAKRRPISIKKDNIK